MLSSQQSLDQSLDHQIEKFFQLNEGEWRSQRRYYTLKSGTVEEIVSLIKVKFLQQESEELIQLAQLHNLEDVNLLVAGTQVSWESSYPNRNSSSNNKPSTGSTIFGVFEDKLYRDRGFATTKPIVAKFYLRDSNTMHLRTEYNGSVFEEELKLIGSQYRTRQTVISRAGEEQMIGQYLETRTK
ncbi:MAG: phycobiliprotein lyase [Cyanobacteria bacterium P01_A01_bin.45]